MCDFLLVIVSPIAIAYSMGQITKSVSVFPDNHDDDHVTDLSSLFDEAADQLPPSIESATRTELIGLHQVKDLFEFVRREEHPYCLRSGVLVRAC